MILLLLIMLLSNHDAISCCMQPSSSYSFLMTWYSLLLLWWLFSCRCIIELCLSLHRGIAVLRRLLLLNPSQFLPTRESLPIEHWIVPVVLRDRVYWWGVPEVYLILYCLGPGKESAIVCRRSRVQSRNYRGIKRRSSCLVTLCQLISLSYGLNVLLATCAMNWIVSSLTGYKRVLWLERHGRCLMKKWLLLCHATLWQVKCVGLGISRSHEATSFIIIHARSWGTVQG